MRHSVIDDLNIINVNSNSMDVYDNAPDSAPSLTKIIDGLISVSACHQSGAAVFTDIHSGSLKIETHQRVSGNCYGKGTRNNN